MAEFKQTGFEWLPELPRDWEFRRLATIGTFSKGGNISRSELLDEEGGKPAILYGDIYTKYNIEVEKAVNRISVETSEKAVEIKSGAILLTGSGETKEDIGKCVVYLGSEPAFAGGDVIVFSQNGCDSKFLSYALNSRSAIYQKTIFGKGDIIVHIYGSQLRDLKIGLPTLSTQTAIVRYLDRQTAAIRHFLEKKQQLVALLKEQRQAIINEAVTRGIDPEAKMKDSGVAWLGEVPEGWEVRRLKNCIETSVSGGTPSMDNREYWDGDIPWVSPKDMKFEEISTAQMSVTQKALDNSVLKLIPKNSALIVVRSGILRNTIPIGITTEEVTINQDIKAMTFYKNVISTEYFLLIVLGMEQTILVNCRKQTATVESIEMPLFMSFKIPVPPLNVQQSIIAHLRRETQTIDTAIEKAIREMDLMREYREAMIGEAVTGQLEISA